MNNEISKFSILAIYVNDDWRNTKELPVITKIPNPSYTFFAHFPRPDIVYK